MPKRFSKEAWTKHVDAKLRFHMESTAHWAYENGKGLLQDAEILNTAQRHSRALALSVLAEEEFAKALILLVYAHLGRWDSALFKALHSHGKKQGIADEARVLSKWFVDNAHEAAVNGKRPMPPPEVIATLTAARNATAKDPYKDYLKQTGFYVSINEDACLISKPTVFDGNDIKPQMEAAKTLEQALDLIFNPAFMDSLNSRRWPAPGGAHPPM